MLASAGSIPHPHKPAQQQLSIAARNAEALFEAKNVAEIRQVPIAKQQLLCPHHPQPTQCLNNVSTLLCAD